MMNRDNDKYWEEIDDFLDRKQSSEEKQSFEQRLHQDTDLSADLTLQRSLRQGISHQRSGELKNRLQQIQQEHRASRAKVVGIKGNWRNWMAVAAVLAIAVLGVIFWTQSQPATNTDTLFAQHYQPYELYLTIRGEELSPDLTRLDELYAAGDFVAVEPLLEQNLATDPNNANLLMARVITDWENGKKTAATQQLEALFSHPLLKDRAYWYAGLFALHEGNLEKAKQYLQQIKTDSGQLYEQAQNLLQALN